MKGSVHVGFSVEHIRKSYGIKPVLKNITFTANTGTITGILGGNGSGKSTLLGVLAGVIKPGSGRFMYDGKDLLTSRALRSEMIGFVPQGTPLIEELSAKDNLLLWYSWDKIKEQLKSGVLGMLGIDEFLNVPVRKMSGGMKKRLSIGCAVSHMPRLLLLDEPSAALDLPCREHISNYLKAYSSYGGTVIIATHDVSEIELCDSLYIMSNGVLEPYEFDGNIHRLAGRLAYEE